MFFGTPWIFHTYPLVNQQHSYGKSQCLIVISCYINYEWPCSIAMSHIYQRLYSRHFPTILPFNRHEITMLFPAPGFPPCRQRLPLRCDKPSPGSCYRVWHRPLGRVPLCSWLASGKHPVATENHPVVTGFPSSNSMVRFPSLYYSNGVFNGHQL